MKRIPKEVTVRDFRSNLAEMVESTRAPQSQILSISPDHKTEDVYLIGEKALDQLNRRHTDYMGALNILRALDLDGFKTISGGAKTGLLGVDQIVLLTEIFALTNVIVTKAYEDGPDFVFNKIDVCAHLDERVNADVRLSYINQIIPKLFEFDTDDIPSLSLGVFIKNMREGFDMTSLLKANKDSDIAQTFNAKILALPQEHIKIIDDVLKVVQDLLMQPRESRIAGETYAQHLNKHLVDLISCMTMPS